MKIALLFSIFIFANEPTTTTVPPANREANETVTIKDAKAQCKEQGKTGKELLQCIKDLKN
jgi:hypothetical protein